VPRFDFDVVDGPVALALDGEVAGRHSRATFQARYRALQVYRPSTGRLPTSSAPSRARHWCNGCAS
jgi:hypothetical protein